MPTRYFSRAIRDNIYICWLAALYNQIIGVGGMAIREQPDNFKNPSGKTGCIMNRYTAPAHRRTGICSILRNKLTDAAQTMGINAFELHATKAGEPVYKRHGFMLHEKPTYRKYTP